MNLMAANELRPAPTARRRLSNSELMESVRDLRKIQLLKREKTKHRELQR